MNFLFGLLLIATLQMPVPPPDAKLEELAILGCPTPSVVSFFTHSKGYMAVYSLVDDTVFGVVILDKTDQFVAAFVYEDGKVVKYTSPDALDKNHLVCDDAAKAAIRKKGI